MQSALTTPAHNLLLNIKCMCSNIAVVINGEYQCATQLELNCKQNQTAFITVIVHYNKLSGTNVWRLETLFPNLQ